ncbi:MAG: dihydroneopterin aldolase [Bacteroidia bacterium]|nr:dihydroneopterin aldolase [Bacteroidia bacterium]
MGQIALEGIEIWAYHGVHARERQQGNAYTVDVYLEAPLEAAAESDALADTVDYFQVYRTVLQVMDQPANLLERLAGQIAGQILAQFALVEACRVRVSKKRPMSMGKCAQTAVELTLSRKDAANRSISG